MKNYIKVKLGDIASFSFGFHTNVIQSEGIMYLQARNFDDDGIFLHNVENFISRVNVNPHQLLNDGDILLVGKGMRFFASCYKKEMGEAVASSIFYVVKADRDNILPGYLTCLLNHSKTQQFFNSIGAGTSIPSIRRNELADLKIDLPPLNMQQKIVDIYKTHQEELQVLAQLKEKNKIRLNQIINELTK